MGRVGKTAQRTFEVADELVALGVTPTVTEIRKITQQGSFSTISRALQEWRELRGVTDSTSTAYRNSNEEGLAGVSASAGFSAPPSPGTSSPPSLRIPVALENRLSALAGMLESYVQQSAKIALGMESLHSKLATLAPALERTAHNLEGFRKEFREGYVKMADHIHYSHAISQMNIEGSREQAALYKQRYEAAVSESQIRESVLSNQNIALQQAITALKESLEIVTTMAQTQQSIGSPSLGPAEEESVPSPFSEPQDTSLWE